MTTYKRETIAALRARLSAQLDAHAAGLKSDPQANAVKRLAYDISREVEDRSIAFRDVEALVKQLSDEAAIERARRLRSRAGLDRIDNLRASVAAVAEIKAAEGWDAFKAWAEAPASGIVLTALPRYSQHAWRHCHGGQDAKSQRRRAQNIPILT
jgi:phosphoenolpyruvate carboxylase